MALDPIVGSPPLSEWAVGLSGRPDLLSHLAQRAQQAQGQPLVTGNLNSVLKKWSKYAGAVDPNVAGPLIAEDVRRVSRGSSPIGKIETALAVRAGSNVRLEERLGPDQPAYDSAFQDPKRNLAQRLASDAIAFGRGIFTLPFDVLREAKALPAALPGIAGDIKQIASGDVRQGLAELSEEPGVRFAPGAFTVSALARGEGERLREHPLFAALDLTPYAGRITRKVTGKPLRTVLAEGVKSLEARASATPTLQRFTPSAVASRFQLGGNPREVARAVNRAERERNVIVSKLSAENDKILSRHGITDRDAFNAHRTGLEREGRGYFDRLPENERAAFTEIIDIQNRLTENYIAKGEIVRASSGELLSMDDLKAVTLGGHSIAHYIRERKRLQSTVISASDVKKVEAVSARLAKLETMIDKGLLTATPTRFKPFLQDVLNERLVARADDLDKGAGLDKRAASLGLDGPEQLVDLALRQNQPGLLGVATKDAQRLMGDVTRNWKRLSDEAGIDPLYFHHAPREVARAIKTMKVTPEQIRDPSQLKRRTLNAADSSPDVILSLDHAQAEYLNRTLAEGVVEGFRELGKTGHLGGILDRDAALAYATRAALERTKGATENLGAEVTRQFEANFEAFDEGVFGLQRAKTGAVGPELYVHKDVARTLKGFGKIQPAFIRKGVDPITKLFRFSVLTMSPAYYANNAISGALLLAVRTGPSALKHFKEGWAMVREDRIPKEIPGGSTAFPDSYGEAVGANVERVLSGPAGKIVRGTVKFQERAFAMANMLDDFYRSVAYLYGEEKGGHVEGLRAAQKVLQDWDARTPFERNILRQIMPFSSWTSFILKYVFSLPFDHPVRASFVSGIARIEQEDAADRGFSERIQRLAFFGPMKDGKAKSLSLGGMTPFMDIGSYGSIKGILGHLHPLLVGGLAAMGIDPAEGTPEQGLRTVYDPVSGRQTVVRPSALTALVEAVVPHTKLLEAALDPDLRAYEARTAGAGERRRYGALGLRFIPTDRNLIEEAQKQERARFTALRDALSDAVRRGDSSRLEAYIKPLTPYQRRRLKAMVEQRQTG